MIYNILQLLGESMLCKHISLPIIFPSTFLLETTESVVNLDWKNILGYFFTLTMVLKLIIKKQISSYNN